MSRSAVTSLGEARIIRMTERDFVMGASSPICQQCRNPCYSARNYVPLRQTEDKQRRSSRDRHLLFAVDHERDRRRPNRSAELQFPKRLARLGFEREEISLFRAAENQTAAGGQ